MSSQWKEGLVRIAFGVIALCGWWGAIYPEFTLTEGCIQLVSETDCLIQDEDVCKILMEEECEIVFKSRLLEKIQKLFLK